MRESLSQCALQQGLPTPAFQRCVLPEIRWSRRVGAEAIAREIDRLAAEQTDRRIAIWLEVRHGGRRMTEVARRHGYRDGSGVHRVVQRLEARATQDEQLGIQLRSLADRLSSVKQGMPRCDSRSGTRHWRCLKVLRARDLGQNARVV